MREIGNKRGQSDVVTFAFVVIGLLILAPFIMKIVTTPLQKFSQALNQSQFSGSNASAEIGNIQGKFTSFFDTIILIAFLINVILLLITSFLVDVHPAFLIIYIILAILTLIFAPMLSDSLDKIYSATGGFSSEVENLTMTKFVYEHLGIILLAVFIVSGIIMYAKFKFSNG